ncbi:hypothetical protein Zmor_006894 [Zophobas morio]|uniref:FAM234A/B beta-propeller domain-containing protein n=1 Tax=Zophobas morio TaxID=2755281 RepID=A0AA38ISQ5_9CUCU|nr:hypothetical protein Zmor_006894 [Zophobas morio]
MMKQQQKSCYVINLEMATYPGMSLGGEVRESISLDEDDLSDVEDEVFIRDGKNSYKLAEELNVKRPLMAPRRKLGKQDLTSRLKAKPPCKAFCKPCCYIFAALSILIGIIALVVILVSIFPLPLDRLRDWIISKSKPVISPIKLLPCSNLKVTDVWATNLPILTTDSPVRILDLDNDGVEDIIFGFGTGDNYNVLPPEMFCPIFLGVPPPCEGGVIALNGTTGDIVWRYWVNDTIFGLQCSADLNSDGLDDCLAVGTKGTFIALNAKNGSLVWRQNNNKMDVFVANFVPDQNNDSVADILSSHTSLNSRGKGGHLVLTCGKTGKEIKRITIPYQVETFFMPQLLKINDTYHVMFGTGSPVTPGNLSITALDSLMNGNMSIRTLYADNFKGVITQSVLVDITGDNVSDIVTAMFNSTVVALNGLTLKQIWNYTIPNSESNVTPTPGYFNDDNVTDFLVIYEKYDNILNYNYTETFILDGKTGKPIYSKSISGSVATQMNGLSLGMESHGFDMFLFWTTECTNIDFYNKNKVEMEEVNIDNIVDMCRKQFNTSSIMMFNALNQYDQPPGFEIYKSVNKTYLEFNNTKSPLRQIKHYFMQHHKIQIMRNEGQSEVDENYLDDSQKINVHKYGSSSFRHKDNRQGIAMSNVNSNVETNDNPNEKFENDDSLPLPPQMNVMNERPDEGTDYVDDAENPNILNQEPILYDNPSFKSNRDPRSKEETKTSPDSSEQSSSKSKKKNLSNSKYGIYDYENIKKSRNRLLNDLNNLPWDILRDTYYKNRESQLRKTKFEQRDLSSHVDKIKENEELKNIIDEERKSAENTSYTLWDLESEKEIQDKENGYWRGKREINYTFAGIRKITSVGAILNSTNTTNNAVDVVFITYWQPSRFNDQEMIEEEINDCLKEKLASDQAHLYVKNTAKEQKDLYITECRNELANLKDHFEYFNQIYQLSLGQMTVYRMRIECVCDVQKADERCAKFLPQNEQGWPTYLGKLGDGVFPTRD